MNSNANSLIKWVCTNNMTIKIFIIKPKFPSHPSRSFNFFIKQKSCVDRLCRNNTLQLPLQHLLANLIIKKVIVRILKAERLPFQNRCSRSIRRITTIISLLSLCNKVRNTHIVKQSHMKLNACGLIFCETSSGIGGASFSSPSL